MRPFRETIVMFTACILANVSLQASELVIPLKDLPDQLDPQKIETIYEMILNLQVHRGLMRFLPNLTLSPDIAESYEVFDSGKRIRFKLAKRYFSDGKIIKAEHVVRTFQRLFVQRLGLAADLDYIQGAKEIISSKRPADNAKSLGVQAIDDSTVEFRLVQPVAVFLTHLATVDAAILPVNVALKFDSDPIMGAGPYRLVSLLKNEIKLKLREDFDPSQLSSEASPPREIRFVKMSTDEAISSALAGSIDSLDGYSIPADVNKTLSSNGWSETVSTITKQLFIVQNPKLNKVVRDVIFDAVMSYSDPLVHGPYSKSYGLIPNSITGALKQNDLVYSKPSPIKKSVTVTLTIVQGEPTLVELASSLASLLKPLNIKLETKSIPLSNYLTTLKGSDYELLIRSKFLDYPDGISILTYFKSTYSANTFFVSSNKVDELINRAFGELNVDSRVKIYKEIQKKILMVKTVVPVVFGSDNHGLWRSSVVEVPAHPLGLQGLPFETLRVSTKKMHE